MCAIEIGYVHVLLCKLFLLYVKTCVQHICVPGLFTKDRQSILHASYFLARLALLLATENVSIHAFVPPLSISVPLITFVNCVNYSTSVSFSFNADLIYMHTIIYFFLTMYQSSIEYKLALNSKTHYSIHYHVLDLIWKNYTSVQNTYISYERQILYLCNHRYKFFMLHVFF